MWDSITSWSVTDWLSIISGLLYVALAAKGKKICWLFGIISCAIIAYEDFTRLKLYSDGILQVIYVVLGVIGLLQWSRAGSRDVFTSLSFLSSMQWWILASLLALPGAYLFSKFTDAAYPFLDAWTTTISLVATWLTIKKVLQNWVFWIVADIAYIFLYTQRDAPAFAFLFIIYTLIAVYGWFSWQKMIVSPKII